MYSYTIGKNFEEYSLLDEAVLVYETAMKQDPSKDFNVPLARIYGEQGKLDKMFSTYLNLMLSNPAYRAISKRNFSQFVNEDPTNEANIIMRKTLLRRLQQEPDILYNELLSWLFIQQKEFKKAFAQEKAIYRRSEQDLTGIIDLVLIALEEKAYEDAMDIVDFAISNSPTLETALQGQRYRMKILLATATKETHDEVEKEFQKLFDAYGLKEETYALQIDYNHFLAFQAGKKDIAVENLKTLSNNVYRFINRQGLKWNWRIF